MEKLSPAILDATEFYWRRIWRVVIYVERKFQKDKALGRPCTQGWALVDLVCFQAFFWIGF
jgi:hypothetical protein